MSYFEQPILRREYLRKVAPCWSCSRPLAIVKGRVVAAIRLIDGMERKTHVNCVGPLLDELEARGLVTDRFEDSDRQRLTEDALAASEVGD